MTRGRAVAEISKLLGKPFFPWQRYVADVATEVDPDTGGPWYSRVVVLNLRRTGKTTLIPPVTAQACGGASTSQVWITAQKRDNAVKRWREATRPLVPLLSPHTAKRKVGQGFEELRWIGTESLFRPFAPDEDSMHGEDPDVVFVDELWSFSLSKFQSVREGYAAAWSVKPGQEWLMTAAGTHASTALKAIRKAGREATADPTSRTAFFEWCIPEEIDGVPAGRVDAEDLLPVIWDHHPRAGFGLDRAYVLDELRKNKTAALRAYGGLDADTSEQSLAIADTSWRRSMNRHRRIPTTVRVAFGLSSDPELRQAAISAAWRDPSDQRILTEVIEERDQVRWVVGAAADLLGRWEGSVLVVRSDQAGRDLADAVATELRARGLGLERLVRVSQSDHAAACHRIRSGLEMSPEPLVLHLGERSLRAALQNAGVQRGVWTAVRGPIAVLEAHTLAVWGANRVPEPAKPQPKFQVW